jgi:hypothetical protein
MIRIIAKLFAVTVALTAFLHVAPLFAAPVGYVSSTGTYGNPCTAALPCAIILGASAAWGGPSGDIACLNFPSIIENDTIFGTSNVVTIDCAGVLNMSTLISQLLK